MTCSCNSSCTCSDTEIKQIVADAVAEQSSKFTELTQQAGQSATAADSSANEAVSSATQAASSARVAGSNATAASESANQSAQSAAASASSAASALNTATALKATSDSLSLTASRLSDKVDSANSNAELAETYAAAAKASATDSLNSATSAGQASSTATVASATAAAAASSANTSAATVQSLATQVASQAATVEAKVSDLDASVTAASASATAAASSASESAASADAAAVSKTAADTSAETASTAQTAAELAAKQAQGFAQATATGIQTYANEAAVLATTPTVLTMARTADTGYLYYWNGTQWLNLEMTLDDWGADLQGFHELLHSTEDSVTIGTTQYETWTKLVNIFKVSGAALAFDSVSELMATVPAESNVLAIDASSGIWYYWNGSSWAQTSWQLIDEVSNITAILMTAVKATMSQLLTFSGSTVLSESITLANDSLFELASISRSNSMSNPQKPVDNITLTNSTSSEVVFSHQVLPGDSLTNSLYKRTARKLVGKDWSVDVGPIIGDSVIRVRDSVNANYVDPFSDQNAYLAFDLSGTLATTSAVLADSVSVPSVSQHPGGVLQISLPIATLTAEGYTPDAAGASSYIKEKLANIELYYQSNTAYTITVTNVLKLPADKYTLVVDDTQTTYKMHAYGQTSVQKSALASSARNVLTYNKAQVAPYTQRLFSGDALSVKLNTRGKKRVRIDSAATDYSASLPQIISANLDGIAVVQKVLPPSGFGYSDGAGQSYYKPVPFAAMTFLSVQYRNGSSIVSASNANFVLIKYDPGIASMQYSGSYAAIDLNNTFNAVSGATAGSTNQTAPSISGGVSGTTPVVQFTIPVSVLTEEGIALTDQTAIINYIATKMLNSVVWVRLSELTTQSNFADFLEFLVDEGELTFSFSTSSLSASVSVFTEQEAPMYDRTGYYRQTAEVRNTSGQVLTQVPVAIKVAFPAGTIFDSDGLIVTNSAGEVLDAQFADEFHPNPRQLTNIGYHTDGSLNSGVIYVYDDFAIDAVEYYEIRAFASPVSSNTKTSLTLDTLNPNNRFLTFDGYTFNFSLSAGWQLASVTDANSVALKVGVVHTPSNGASVNTETPAVYCPSIRVVNSGDVFVDVEAISYNVAASPYLNAGDLKYRTIYRIFKDGKVYIKNYVTAVNEIGVGKLVGITSRLNFTDFTPTITTPIATMMGVLPNAANLGVVLLHNTGDQHRDGTNYGPTRPVDYRYLSPSSTSRRLYTGWKFTSLSDYSLLNWPVTKNWTWTSGIWVDLNCAYTDATTFATIMHNLPAGFASQVGFAFVKKQQMLNRIKEIVDGTMDWWYNNSSTTLGNGKGSLASVTYEIMKALTDGTHSLDYMYSRFKTYCNKYWGSFTDPGTYYTSGNVVLQYASRTVIPVYHWLYKWAVKAGDTAKIAELQAAIASYAAAVNTHYLANGGINLNGNGTGPGNSNSNATGAVILALAVYAGQDTSDSAYAAAAEAVLTNLETRFTVIKNIFTDGRSNVLANDHWSHYQMFTWNNYFIACELLGRTPAIAMDSYVCQIAAGIGGMHDIDYNVSESRRGNFNTVGFMSYPILASSNSSLMGYLDRTLDLWDSEFGAQQGLPRRMFGFDGTQNGTSVTDVGFNGTNLSECILREYFRDPIGG